MDAKYYFSAMGVPYCPSKSDRDLLPKILDADGNTGFPRRGDDEDICFENSKFELFPFNLAIALAVHYPKAWCRGGNHFGNHAFENWANAMLAMREGRAVPERSLRWMKKREQYIARHRGDFRLAGIIAMIKWAGFVDGPKAVGNGSEDGSSLNYMVSVIEKYGK